MLVGSTFFHVEPVPLKPRPPEVLQTLLESVGYHPVDVRFVHPHEKLEVLLRDKRLDDEIAYLLFGPQFTAILARKPDLDPCA